MSDEDFCLIHGRDDMRFDRGPISYCAECERPPLKRGERFTLANSLASISYGATLILPLLGGVAAICINAPN